MLQHFSASLSPTIPRIARRVRPTGLVAGTLIGTDQGAVPVEYLLAGDRIETARHEFVELRGTSLVEARDIDVALIDPAALGAPEAQPGATLVVPISQQILIHDWRAQILHGQSAMLTPASSLVDDLLVTRETRAVVRLIRLHFDTPQVIFANGIEVASARTRAPDLASDKNGRGLLH